MKLARHHFSPIAVPLAAVALSLVGLRAQPAQSPAVPDTLDLRTAITFALDNNFAIRQARERIKQQEGVVIEVSARSIPNVAADAAYQLNDKDLSQSFPASDQAWQINLTASQVLYSGGGVRSAIKSSKLTRDAAVLDLQAVINGALLQVRTNFYTVLLAREQIKVQESNLALLEQQLKTTTDRFTAGTISSFEKLRAEVAVANSKVPLIVARNDYRLAIEALRASLGFTTNRSDSVRKVPEFIGTLEFSPSTYDLQAAFDSARANRPDVARLTKLAEAGEETVALARAGRLPTVSAFGGLSTRRGATNSLSDANSGWLLGVQSQWAIFDGRATSGRVAQARSAVEQLKLAVAEAELGAEIEVRQAFSQWQQAVELSEASKLVVDQATEAVRLADSRYGAGTATQLDVLQAQTDLTTARTNQLRAYYGYNVAIASLRKAMGQADEFVTK